MRAYRYQNLIYIPIYKNAASSHEKFFGQILNWEVILSENIDWNNDKVFSHISNPYHRHLRGTAEFLFKFNLESIVDEPRLEPIVSSAYFDQHCYPLHMMFGEKIKKITWLPIDHPQIPSNVITGTFLKNQGLHIDKSHIPYLNKSNDKKLQMLDRLKQIGEKNNYKNEGLYFILDDDEILYWQVIRSVDQWI